MSGARLDLSVALWDNGRTRPLLDGRIAPEGLRLIPSALHPSEIFWRQLRFAEFDVSEMSLASLIIATSKHQTPWVAIPVYTIRRFFHTRILVRDGANITVPADLRGKRVGVPEYQQTSAIWARGILEHEFGVRSQDIDWFMERGADKSHGGATGFESPPGVRVTQIPPTTNIGEMLINGALDATLLYITDPNLVDRSRIDLTDMPMIRPLFPDVAAEGRRYYAKTGVYPINHTIVVRRELLERHPWIALNLYSAFNAAKDEWSKQGNLYLHAFMETGELDAAARKILKKDPMPYGLKANRAIVETVAQYVYEQGLSDRLVGMEEIFAASTLDL